MGGHKAALGRRLQRLRVARISGRAIDPLHSHRRQFAGLIEGNLRLRMGLDCTSVRRRVREIDAHYDARFVSDFKRGLPS